MSTRAAISIEGVVPWPDEVAQAYRKAGYWQGTSLASHIAGHVRRRPDDEALIDGATRLTYQQLWDRSAACAQALLDLGMSPGDRIVVQLPNCWNFVALVLGCFRTGIIPVLALPAHRSHEITHMAMLSEATAIAVADFDSDTDLRQMAQQVAAVVPSIRAVLVHGELSPTGVDHAPEYSLAASTKTSPRFLKSDY
jgi:non-ribosomal peptide synthetase component E (peptide arylation enzyme)